MGEDLSAPDGFDLSCVHICSITDGEDYVIRVGERTYFFEWSDMFGPLFVGARGQDIDNTRIQESALVAVSLWKRQGMQTAPQGKHLRAIWAEPATATHYYVRRGRSREIIRSDEPPGYDADFSQEIFIDVTEPNPRSTHDDR